MLIESLISCEATKSSWNCLGIRDLEDKPKDSSYDEEIKELKREEAALLISAFVGRPP